MQNEPNPDERWAFERVMREREMALAERRLEHEIASGGRREGWASPLVVAVLAAAVAAGGNAVVSYVEGEQNRALEEQRAEYSRIQAMLEANDPDVAAENLDFLVQVGLVSDPDVLGGLKGYLGARSPGTGAVLAPAGAGYVARSRRIPRNEASERRLLASTIEARLCQRDPGAAAHGVLDPFTVKCLERFLGASTRDARKGIKNEPELLVRWVLAGVVPDDWRKQLRIDEGEQ